MQYKSIVWWPKEVCLGSEENTSEDIHIDKESAEHVCRMLKRHGLGLDGKIFPIKTEVKPCEDN